MRVHLVQGWAKSQGVSGAPASRTTLPEEAVIAKDAMDTLMASDGAMCPELVCDWTLLALRW